MLGVAAIALLLLSTGYFVGFTTYVPVQKARAKASTVQKMDAEQTRLADLSGRPAPAIVSETLTGESWRLADQRGKVVLVFVWSILCDDCAEAIPTLNRIHAAYAKREDFALVGVHGFPQKDVISCYVAAKGISWPQLYEGADSSQGFLKTLGLRRTPSVCIVDREGRIRVVRTGLGDVEGEVQRLLASKAAN